jgi:hypothetical protein
MTNANDDIGAPTCQALEVRGARRSGLRRSSFRVYRGLVIGMCRTFGAPWRLVAALDGGSAVVGCAMWSWAGVHVVGWVGIMVGVEEPRG